MGRYFYDEYSGDNDNICEASSPSAKALREDLIQYQENYSLPTNSVALSKQEKRPKLSLTDEEQKLLGQYLDNKLQQELLLAIEDHVTELLEDEFSYMWQTITTTLENLDIKTYLETHYDMTKDIPFKKVQKSLSEYLLQEVAKSQFYPNALSMFAFLKGTTEKNSITIGRETLFIDICTKIFKNLFMRLTSKQDVSQLSNLLQAKLTSTLESKTESKDQLSTAHP